MSAGHRHDDGQDHDHGREPVRAESAKADGFDALMSEVMATAERFGHREHVHLTWLAVLRFGTTRAIDLVSDGIQRTARYAGAPRKYHATMSRAWVELVGHHALARTRPGDVWDTSLVAFESFAARNAELLDKRLLTRFYRSATLAGDAARTSWLEPDLAPFPWSQGAGHE